MSCVDTSRGSDSEGSQTQHVRKADIFQPVCDKDDMASTTDYKN
jgi:hypothetical protein